MSDRCIALCFLMPEQLPHRMPIEPWKQLGPARPDHFVVLFNTTIPVACGSDNVDVLGEQVQVRWHHEPRQDTGDSLEFCVLDCRYYLLVLLTGIPTPSPLREPLKVIAIRGIGGYDFAICPVITPTRLAWSSVR